MCSWDEAHFGKFGSHYLKREFYFDVHPPLGKMLVGLAGYVAGYNGSFSFDSGTEYPEWVDFVRMRMFVATFGALAVPLAYMTARQMSLSEPASLLVGICMLLGNTCSLALSLSLSLLSLIVPCILSLTREWIDRYNAFDLARLHALVLYCDDDIWFSSFFELLENVSGCRHG